MQIEDYEIIINEITKKCAISIDTNEYQINFLNDKNPTYSLDNNTLTIHNLIKEVVLTNLTDEFISYLKNDNTFILLAGKVEPIPQIEFALEIFLENN